MVYRYDDMIRFTYACRVMSNELWILLALNEDHITLLIQQFQEAILSQGKGTIWDALKYARNAGHNFKPVSWYMVQWRLEGPNSRYRIAVGSGQSCRIHVAVVECVSDPGSSSGCFRTNNSTRAL